MRPAIWMATALAVGVAAAQWLRPHPLLALAFFLGSLVWVGRTRMRIFTAVLLAVALFGTFRYAYDQTAGRGELAAFLGQKVTIVGTVTEEPELRKPRGTTYVVTVETVGEAAVDGRLWVVQYAGSPPHYGERVVVQGSLKQPPGPRTPDGFDQAAYLSRKGIYTTLETAGAEVQGPGNLSGVLRAAVTVRTWLEGTLHRILPQRDAALMAGLLFGSRSDLPADLREAFRATGVFHLLAVSGGNIAIVLTAVLWGLRHLGLSRRRAAAVGLPVVIFFVFVTGASPSVVRAGVMAVLVLLGQMLLREQDTKNTLGAAVFIVLLGAPSLLFDIGFQLSVAATLGIVLLGRAIQAYLLRLFEPLLGRRVGRWTAEGLSVTLAAQALVEPLSLHYFGALSTVAPLANLVVLAVLGPITYIGWSAALLGWLPVMGEALGWVSRFLLWALVALVKGTAAIPGGYLEVGRLPLAGVLLWYGTLVALAAPSARHTVLEALKAVAEWVHKATGGRERIFAALCIVLILITGLTWRRALADAPDTLRVTVLDVGQGDAIVVEAPGGHTMLIDAGPASPPDPQRGFAGQDAGREVVLPFLRERGIRRLDAVVLTHPHQDHAGGIAAVLEEVPVDLILDPQWAHDAEGYIRMLQSAAHRHVPTRRPVAGEHIDLGSQVTLDVLHPGPAHLTGTRSDENSNSIVLRLRYRDVAMLFAGDMEAVVEERLLAEGAPIRADVLKVAHHGSEYSSTRPFLAAVQPEWAIISAGAGNLFGHPAPMTMQRLAGVGAQVYRTDLHGSVTVKSDGLHVQVAAVRATPLDPGYRPVGVLGRRILFAW